MAEETQNTNDIYWRSFELAAGFVQSLQIGPTKIQVAHLDREWWISATRNDEAGAATKFNKVVIDPPVALDASTAGSHVNSDIKRYATSKKTPGFRLMPVLPDLPVVCRPLNPFFVLPGDQVEFYVSIPVWIKVLLNSSNDNDGTAVAEIPALLLNKTWVGSTTVEGEIAYASNTRARLNFGDVPLNPHMATTGAIIRNLAAKPLALDYLSIPTGFLHTYATPEGSLSTDGILLEHREGGVFADLEIMSHPLNISPGNPANQWTRIGPARRDPQEQSAVRAFSSFLSRREPTS